MVIKKLANIIVLLALVIAIIGLVAIVVYWLSMIHWTVPAFVGCLTIILVLEKYLEL